MTSPTLLTYQLLALDPAELTRCENALGLLFLIRGFTKLWNAPQIDESQCQIKDGHVSLLVTRVEKSEESDSPGTEDSGLAFILTLNGPYEEIEPRREPLAAFLKAQEFDKLYVLRDQASERIACELYPHLYRIENLLRGYLIRFMATQIGPNWWELTASSDMSRKAKIRRKNERVFSKHVETSAYLIDFDEIGQIVFEQSSGLLTREDIAHRIAGLPETPEAIRELKQDMRSNYQKLFKESFADKDFKDKWKLFDGLRNKIAHNNLFTADDLKLGKELSQELTEIISVADDEATKLVITDKEREAIKQQASAHLQDLTEEEFISKLEEIESKFRVRDMFVGLTYFLNNVLIPMGYSYFHCRHLVEQLKKTGRIEIYYVPHHTDSTRQTAAIRRPTNNQD